LNSFLQLSIEVRCIAIALVGILYAAFANCGIYQLSFYSQHYGPWSQTKPDSGAYTWLDRIPIYGWIRLRRFEKQFGRNFWLRPLLIEIFLPVFLAWLYYFEIQGGLLPHQNAVRRMLPQLQPLLQWQFIAHALLVWAMCVATFIDFDEKLIPDWITVPGACIGLIGSTFINGWHFFQIDRNGINPTLMPLNSCSPGVWAQWLGGPYGLALALFCYGGWCFGLANRRWRTGRGLKMALKIFFLRLIRYKPWFWTVVSLWVLGTLGIAYVYSGAVGNWQALLSGLIGMAIAGSIVWAVRIVASNALGMEAMGFGDVTLMAMIGTFIGWQPSLLVFFIAPFVSLLFVFSAWLLTGEKEFPFGPYLCTATLIVLVFWNTIWNGWASNIFELGRVLFAIMLVALVAMGVMLVVWRWIRDRFLLVEDA
jgi:prepilin signal peptidase PulO-like enzyme (type II secretory pathway)